MTKTFYLIIAVLMALALFFFALSIYYDYNYYQSNHKQITCIDGDTFKLNDEYIRLAYIDTPEKNEPSYNESSLFTCNWLNNNDFEINRQGQDIYGRTLATIAPRGSKHPLVDNLNALIVSKCLAKPFYNNTTLYIIKLFHQCK